MKTGALQNKALRVKALILATCLLGSLSATAQWEFGVGTCRMAPVDRFVGSVYNPSFGICTQLVTSSLLNHAKPQKLQLGFYMDAARAGNEKIDVELTEPLDAEGQTTFRNSNGGQHFFVRYGYLASPKTLIFTDLIVGHRRFFSNATTGLKAYDPDFEPSVEHIHSYHTYRHGIGFGIRYGFGEAFGLELRADYTRGDNATYFNLNTVEETANAITYKNEAWPHTDLFMGTLQLSWKLFQAPYDPNYTPSYDSNISNTGTNHNSYRSSGSTSSSSSSRQKTTVKSSKPVQEKKEAEKINW